MSDYDDDEFENYDDDFEASGRIQGAACVAAATPHGRAAGRFILFRFARNRSWHGAPSHSSSAQPPSSQTCCVPAVTAKTATSVGIDLL
jgi:hypothetical protein